MNDMKRHALGGHRIVLFDIDTKRGEVIDCLWRPDGDHQRLGIGRSPRLPQDVTQSLTCSCETPSPRSREAIACLMPATCHSLTSRYSLIASAARKDRLRPVLLASLSRRFLAAASTRTVKVAERMISIPGDRLCTIEHGEHLSKRALNEGLAGMKMFPSVRALARIWRWRLSVV